MLLVDSFAQNYRWPIADILALTMPQIIMLNAASEVNRLRMEARMEKRHKSRARPSAQPTDTAMPMFGGKRVDQLSSKEYLMYHQMADNA